MLTIFVPQRVLDCAGILALVRQIEAGSMAQHVRMHRKAQARYHTGASHELAYRAGGQGRFPEFRQPAA